MQYIQISKELLQQVKLDDIVRVEYNEKTLEQNFETIVKILSQLQIGLEKENEHNVANTEQIKNLKNQNERIEKDNQEIKRDMQNVKDENSNLKEEIRQLKERMGTQEKNHEQLKNDHERSKEQINQNQRDIEELQKKIKSLLDKINGLENLIEDLKSEIERLKNEKPILPPTDIQGNVDASALEKLLQEIQKMKGDFVTKKDFEKKCQDYDNEISRIWEELNNLKNRFDDLESQFDKLKNTVDSYINNSSNNNGSGIDESELEALREMIKKRVDIERFEREINNLKKLISQLSNLGDGKEVQIVSGFGDDEKKLLDSLNSKLEYLEEQIRRLRKDVDNNKQEYSRNKDVTDKRLDNLENTIKFKASNEDLQNLNRRVQGVSEDLEQTTALAKENEANIKKLKISLNNLGDGSSNINSNFNNNVKNIDNMDNYGITEELVDEKIRKCKEELLNLLKALKEEKVSFDDLWKSEAVILEKVDEVAGALLKKLADKGDTKKALVYLEKKINQLYLLLTKAGGQQDGDGLIVKRPLFWSCISCDKDLDKFQGRIGEYKNWAVFPPKETTPERMGRFGKGYKQLLEKSKQKEDRMRQEHSQYLQQQSQMNDGTLPNIHKTPGLSTSGQNFYEQQQQ